MYIAAKCTVLAISLTCQTFHENGITFTFQLMCWVNVVLLALYICVIPCDLFIVTATMLYDWRHQY